MPLPFKAKYILRGIVFRLTNWPRIVTAPKASETDGLLNSIQAFSERSGAAMARQSKPYFSVRRPHGSRRAAILTNQLLDWNSGRPRFGGGERYALELARLLRELSIEVTFFQPGLSNKVNGDYYSFEVNLLPVGETLGEFHHSVCTNFTEITADFDHVYYHLPEYASGVVREDGLMTCHGIWFDHNNYPGAIFRTAPWFEHLYRAFKNPNGVVSVDTNSIGVIRSLWPELAKKMRYIPNFFDKKMYYPDFSKRNSDRLTVLFPRRGQINRGSRIFADIVSGVLHDVEIIWLGEGDPVDTQIIKDVSASDKRVSFNVANFDQMPSWYQRADIAVIPTIACEGTSLSCIEALACGCAVIATNVGGLPDVIYDGINGLLVEPNPRSISNAINRLIEDHALRDNLQRVGSEAVNNFELTWWRARWVELLWDYGWIGDQSMNGWLASNNPANAVRTHSKKADKWAILTRNAIHGGVESIIREESRLLNAPVIVCGGHDERETCPFEYLRADNSHALEKAIRDFNVILYHWLPDWALEVIKRSKKISIEFVHRTDTSSSDKTIPTALVTHSTFLAKYIYDRYGRPCRVFDHPIPLDRFVPDENLGNCIGAITSYYEIKGIDIFLRACALLKEEFGHIPVRLYGAGEDLHKFRALASELNIDVDFRGPTREPWKAMKEFQCFVVPSRIEGLPIAVLEALAMDVPVVATALPGMVEFNELSCKRGYESYIRLALPENPEDLAQTIRAVLLHGERKRSRAYITEYYSPNKHCSDFIDLLREVCLH
jgi:glycosyltransferase involved in cell wall biosynthesis